MLIMESMCFFLDSGNLEESLPLNGEVRWKKRSPQTCELHSRVRELQQGDVAWDWWSAGENVAQDAPRPGFDP